LDICSVGRGRTVGTLAAIAAGLILAGCTGTPTADPTPEPDPAGAVEPPAAESSGGDTACVVGTWTLDLPDYEAQAEAYLVSLGIPLESLALSGSMTLDITPIYFGISSALVADAVVHGIPISAPQEFSGGADWQWEADDETTMAFDAWAWGVEPVTVEDAPAAPPLIDPDMPVKVTCAGDRLTVQSAAAPLVGRFTRTG